MGFILPIPLGGFLGPAGDDVLDTTERAVRPYYGEGLYGGEGTTHQGYRRGQAWGQAYIRASMDALQTNAYPDRAIELLDEWEDTLGLPRNTRLTTEERMARVRLRCRTGHVVYRLRYSGTVTGAINAGDWVVQLTGDASRATGVVAVHDTTSKLLIIRAVTGGFDTTNILYVTATGSGNHVVPNLSAIRSDEVASADALSIVTTLSETVGYAGDPAYGPFAIDIYPVVRTLSFRVSIYEFVLGTENRITRTNKWGVDVLAALRRIKPSHTHCFVRWMNEPGTPTVDLGA